MTAPRTLVLSLFTLGFLAACSGEEDVDDGLGGASARLDGSGGLSGSFGTSQPMVVDADDDGVADDLGTSVDLDANGKPDWVDLDGDGRLDGFGVDTDGDGEADAIGYDLDGDGIIDAVDTDGDGEADQTTTPIIVGTGGSSSNTGGSTSATGGSTSATGGSTSNTTEPAETTYDLIDDLEDGNVKIQDTDGRVGYWYSYNENDARPRLDSASSSDGGYAIHATGSHQSGVAADQAYGGLGVDLQNADPSNEGPRSSAREVYDASEWDGFSFRVKGGSGAKSIRFEVVTSEIAAPSENGTCNGGTCWDAFGMDVSLDSSWRTVKVPFSNLVQEGWGDTKTFNVQSILGIAFEDLGTGSWDFWVDDLSFYKEPIGQSGGGSFNPQCAGSWGEEDNGSITWYTFDQGTHSFGDVNCSFGISMSGTDKVDGIQTGSGTYFGAMNTADYATAAACGACVEVTADNGKSVPITIVDQCPIATNPKCVKGHIDLSRAAYDALELSEGYWGQRAGKGSISWKYVPCATTGDVKVSLKEPSNTYWNMILVENHAYPIAKVEVNSSRGGTAVWVNASREEFNYWLPPGGNMGSYEVRITDINGSVITKTISLMSGDQSMGGQFSCN